MPEPNPKLMLLDVLLYAMLVKDGIVATEVLKYSCPFTSASISRPVTKFWVAVDVDPEKVAVPVVVTSMFQ